MGCNGNLQNILSVFGRSNTQFPCNVNSSLRAIHRFDNANNTTNCCVFFFNPR